MKSILKKRKTLLEVLKLKSEEKIYELLDFNIEKIKKDFNDFIKENITDRIEKYFKGIILKILFCFLVFFGLIFIFYSLNSIILTYLNIDDLYHSFIFGFMLLLISYFVYLQFKKLE